MILSHNQGGFMQAKTIETIKRIVTRGDEKIEIEVTGEVIYEFRRTSRHSIEFEIVDVVGIYANDTFNGEDVELTKSESLSFTEALGDKFLNNVSPAYADIDESDEII